MTKVKNMILLAALMAFGLTAMAFAQTSITGKTASPMAKMSPDSTRAMMTKMSENYKAMEKNLTELEHHLQTMMSMKDTDKLDAEMQKHMELMRSMDRLMGDQHRMARMMMGSNMMGRMGEMRPMTGKTMEMKKPAPIEKQMKTPVTTEKEKKN